MAALAKYVKDPDASLDFTIRWGAAAWVTATAYSSYGDVVYDSSDGKFYLCVAGHTSGASRSGDSSKWEEYKFDDGENFFWLDPNADEQISGSPVWSIPAGLTEVTTTNDGYTATAWISGGTAGTTYEVSCEITSDNTPNRIDERTIKIQIKEK